MTGSHGLFGKARTETARQSDPERHSQSTDLVFERDALANQLLARDEKCSNGM
jgi:hypothetical protein